MYIYRAVRSRGKSLQKVLTTKKRVRPQHPATCSPTHAYTANPTPGLVIPSNARGQRQWTRLHLGAQLELSIPWGKGFWFPYRFLAT